MGETKSSGQTLEKRRKGSENGEGHLVKMAQERKMARYLVPSHFFFKILKKWFALFEKFSKKGCRIEIHPSFDRYTYHTSCWKPPKMQAALFTCKSCHLGRLPAECGPCISNEGGFDFDSAPFFLKILEKRKSIFWDFGKKSWLGWVLPPAAQPHPANFFFFSFF